MPNFKHEAQKGNIQYEFELGIILGTEEICFIVNLCPFLNTLSRILFFTGVNL